MSARPGPEAGAAADPADGRPARRAPLPTAAGIEEARRDLAAAGGAQWEHSTEQQRQALAYDAAESRAARAAAASRPSDLEALEALAEAARPGARDQAARALEGTVAAFRRWLLLPDPGALYAVLASVLANRGEGDPTWLLLVGPPGGGKTELLQSVSRQAGVHPAATLTEAALLSGTSRRERAGDAKGGLLREIGASGIILCKDFGSVLSMNRDARAAVLAALREVYDGAWTRHVGTDGGRTLSWEGRVGLVAGCTPAIDAHHAVMGSMGERFVLYRMPPVDGDAQAERALSHVGREGTMRAELAAAAAAALDAADARGLAARPSDRDTARLVRLATLAVRCRSSVDRDAYSREVTLIPEPEAPARMAQALMRMLNALAALGVPEAGRWDVVGRCALDSMPAIRRAALEILVAAPDAAATGEVAEALGYPTTTARRALEDLAAHAVVRRVPGGPGRADRWEATDWTRERWPAGPTVPGMSDGAHGEPPTVPGMSDGAHGERGDGAGGRPVSLPLRTFDDKTGKVPPPSGVDLRAHAESLFADVLADPPGGAA